MNSFSNEQFTYKTFQGPGGKVYDMLRGPKGKLWVSSPTAGLFRMEGDKMMRAFDASHEILNPHKMTLSPDSNIWISTYSSGLYEWQGDTLAHYHEGNGLINNHIRDITFTSQGEAWICTTAGVNRFRGKLFSHITEDWGLPSNLVWDIAHFGKHTFIAHDAGLSRVQRNNIYNYRNELPGVLAFHTTPEYLFACTQRGLYISSNPEAENPEFRKTGNYSTFPYFQVVESRNKKYLYAQVTNFEIHRFDWDPASARLSNPVLLHRFSEEVNDIYEGPEGSLLIGHDLGLSLLNPETKEIRQLISRTSVNHIISLKKDMLALGTSGDGVMFVNVNDWQNYQLDHTSFRRQDGLSSNNVYSLLLENDSLLWAGTEQGLNKLAINKKGVKTVKHYAEEEGFSAIEANHKAVTIDKQGNIWWGTIEGVTKYDPRYEIKTQCPPKIHLTGIDLFYKQPDWLTYTDKFQGWFNIPTELSLPHDQNHLTFHFTGIQLAKNNRLKYSYKLEGLDQDWSPPTGNRQAVYANIPPGTYNFLVKASAGTDNWTREATAFTFVIQKPFYTRWWFIGLMAGSLAFVGFVYTRYKVRRLEQSRDLLANKVSERTAEIEEQKEVLALKNDELEIKSESLQNALDEISRKNFQITSSISYAKRIQEAILPNTKELKKELEEVFLFYRPRDIVSGDFYWTARKNGILYVAVVDCTGHGVPGAFMSMIGHNHLNRVLSETPYTSPAGILNKLDKEVMQALKQSNAGQEAQDGMDVALISVNEDTRQLTFAGAKRPLYMVKDGLLTEIKGGRSSIGGSRETTHKVFEEQSFTYIPGTMIYMSSDGYADQFGGPQDKKFMTGRFKKLLSAIEPLPVKEQRHRVTEAFEDWIMDNEQTDDVLLIGLRLS